MKKFEGMTYFLFQEWQVSIIMIEDLYTTEPHFDDIYTITLIHAFCNNNNLQAMYRNLTSVCKHRTYDIDRQNFTKFSSNSKLVDSLSLACINYFTSHATQAISW